MLPCVRETVVSGVWYLAHVSSLTMSNFLNVRNRVRDENSKFFRKSLLGLGGSGARVRSALALVLTWRALCSLTAFFEKYFG